MDETTVSDANIGDATNPSEGASTDLVDEELLVEEISIDGMCGVY